MYVRPIGESRRTRAWCATRLSPSTNFEGSIVATPCAPARPDAKFEGGVDGPRTAREAEQHAQGAGAAFQALLQPIGELYASSL